MAEGGSKQKICSIVGARPQFVKAAMLSRKTREPFDEIIVHTGQHYDFNMSDVFFNELSIPTPDYELGIGSGTHGMQTGRMLIEIEETLKKENPELAIVFGDTNSTLAGALAAVKLHIPVAHVEAGLRSYEKRMPEEVNRILADEISSLLFCPTESSVVNLKKEGIEENVYLVGDVMCDALRLFIGRAREDAGENRNRPSAGKRYNLLTIHRAESTQTVEYLENILRALKTSAEEVIFPIHPRTRKAIKEFGLRIPENVSAVEPVSYLDMLKLEAGADKILTDSGGVQKEAYMLKIPCVTLRKETEWNETLKGGWNILAGSDGERILSALKSRPSRDEYREDVFGEGNAAGKMVEILKQFLNVENR